MISKKAAATGVLAVMLSSGLVLKTGCGNPFLGLEDYQRDLLTLGGLAALLLGQPADGTDDGAGQPVPGPQGDPGPAGADGTDGLNCWDLNGNGTADLPDEDANGDGVVDAFDCRGASGSDGSDGATGPSGLNCWDLNGNGLKDLATEDANGDGRVDVQDCRGRDGQDGASGGGGGGTGAAGLNCWDLNGNGTADVPAEDTNGDGVVNVNDCRDAGLFSIFIDDFFALDESLEGELPVRMVRISEPVLGGFDGDSGERGEAVAFRVGIPDAYSAGNDVTMRLFLHRTGFLDEPCFEFRVSRALLRGGQGVVAYPESDDRIVTIDPTVFKGGDTFRAADLFGDVGGFEDLFLVIDLPINVALPDGLDYWTGDLRARDLLAFELYTDAIRFRDVRYHLLGVEFFETRAGTARVDDSVARVFPNEEGVDISCPGDDGVCGVSRLFTINADFDDGTLINVNHETADQVRLATRTEPFPFIWVAASNRGTIVRIDTVTGDVLGEFYSAPPNIGFPSPSRTTVDLLGNAWVANRNDAVACVRDGAARGDGGGNGEDLMGSAARVGLIIGGTRVNSDGEPTPDGDFLAPPFRYNTCRDRNGDGLIYTSRGLGDIRPWPNALGENTCGGITTAQDECIINYTRVTGTGTRTIAIDGNNDVWVGGIYGAGTYHNHEKLDGVTGQPIPGTQFNIGCGGYGGFIDRNGILWSAGSGTLALLRYNTNTLTGECIRTTVGDYGLGLDPNTGHIWHSSLSTSPNALYELDTVGTVLNSYPQPFSAQGVTVDSNSHVWMAEIFGSRVWHLAPDPENPGRHVSVGIVSGFNGTTGVAVDAAGKVWATETGDRVSRIDPNAGPTGGGGYPVGEIDLSVPLGDGAGPYNYSDMTGIVGLAAADSGTWTVEHDGEVEGVSWTSVKWNGENCVDVAEPEGTGLKVEVRASDSLAGLPAEPFVEVQNGVALNGVLGRYLQVRVTFQGSTAGEQFLTPVLCDLTVQTECE